MTFVAGVVDKDTGIVVDNIPCNLVVEGNIVPVVASAFVVDALLMQLRNLNKDYLYYFPLQIVVVFETSLICAKISLVSLKKLHKKRRGWNLVALQIKVAAGEPKSGFPGYATVELPRARDRVPHQRGRSEELRAVAGIDYGVSPARRRGRSASTAACTAAGGCRRLRLDAREAHRPRPHAQEAIMRMRRALDEFIVGGIRTNIAAAQAFAGGSRGRHGTMTTRTVERVIAEDAEK